MTQATLERKADRRINQVPAGFTAKTNLPEGFYNLLVELHEKFTPRQQELVKKRRQVLAESHKGNLPNYLAPSEATQGDWRIVIPDWCSDQRNQMTGPADDGELVVKMLNSGAPGVMIDLEDSMANAWENLESGIANSLAALHGELTYFYKKREREVVLVKDVRV